jgi:hypothetical protein
MRPPRLLARLFVLVGRSDLYARAIGVTFSKHRRILTHRFGSESYLIRIGDWFALSRNGTFTTHDGSTWLMRDDRELRRHSE